METEDAACVALKDVHVNMLNWMTLCVAMVTEKEAFILKTVESL